MTLILKKELTKNAERKGHSTMTVSSPSQKSVKNYLDYSKKKWLECFNQVEKIQQKSERRYTTERSIRGMITYLLAVACTHYHFRPHDPKNPKIEVATEGANKLYQLIREKNPGIKICPVLPWFISSTDDATLFVLEGTATNKKEVFLVDKTMDRNTQSAYTNSVGGTNHKKGLWLRHSISMNGNGNMAQIYLTLYGLSEQELPKSSCPDGMLKVKVKGLCYGGGQDCDNEKEDFIIFMRNGSDDELNESNDQRNHELYKRNCFLPWVESVWKNTPVTPGTNPCLSLLQ